ncbi:MAG: SLC13 family permease, partial [Candidatus Odinarchaeia archaeon]
GILIFVYTLILTEKIPRVISALVGAAATVIAGLVFGLFNFEEALGFIELETITLIVGLFIFIEIVNESGLFQFIAIKILRMTKGNPILLFIAFGMITFFLTAIIGNLTAVLIVGSLTIVSCDIFEYNPIPYVTAEIFIANTAGVALITGSIPSILIASEFNITFIDFAIIGFPIALILMGLTIFISIKSKMKKMNLEVGEVTYKVKAQLETFDAWSVVPNRSAFYRSAAILVFIILLFFLSSFIGLTLGFVAITGAIIMLVLSGVDPEKSFRNVHWETVFFFIGLFITIGGVEAAGVLEALGDVLSIFIGSNTLLAVVLIVLITGILSAIVDNIPITLTFIPVIQQLGLTLPIFPLIWSLALGAVFGGNLTPIGSPSGIIALGLLKSSGRRLAFGEYFKISVPVTLMYLGLSIGYIMLIGGLF